VLAEHPVVRTGHEQASLHIPEYSSTDPADDFTVNCKEQKTIGAYPYMLEHLGLPVFGQYLSFFMLRNPIALPYSFYPCQIVSAVEVVLLA